MRTFFPDAIWWVNELEADTYLEAGVPERLLLRHDAPTGYASVVNRLLDVMVDRGVESMTIADDDVTNVWCVPSDRDLAPDEIRTAVDNLRQVVIDLDLSTGTFSHRVHDRIYGGSLSSLFAFNCPILGGIWILRGIGLARRRYRAEFGVGVDVDWALQMFMEERVCISDMRFIVHCGYVLSNPGGNTGLTSPAEEARAQQLFRDVWGEGIQDGSSGSVTKLVYRVSTNVRRSNPRAPTL